jgi:hypothetical protein
MPAAWLIFSASVLQSVAAIGVMLFSAAIPGPSFASIDKAIVKDIPKLPVRVLPVNDIKNSALSWLVRP